MANRLEVHFTNGSKVFIDGDVSNVGRRNINVSGLIEVKESGRDDVNLSINPEHIVLVRDHGPADKAEAGTLRAS